MPLTGARLPIVLLAGVLATGAIAAEPSPGITLRDGRARVVFVGDSITGLGRNMRGGFAHLMDAALKETYPDAEPDLVTLGGSGHGVFSWLGLEKRSRSQESTLDVKNVPVKANLDQTADVLVVTLGMNDVLAPYIGNDDGSLQRWTVSYQQLVEALRARLKPGFIALATTTPCTEDPASPKNRLIAEMNRRVEDLAKELGAVVIPTNQSMWSILKQGRTAKPDFHVTYDFVHPNEAGQIAIALAMLRRLGEPKAAAWLEETRLAPLLAKASAAAETEESRAVPPPWLVAAGLNQPQWQGNVFQTDDARTAIDAAIENGEDFTRAIDIGKGRRLGWKRYVPSVNYTGLDAPGSVDFAAITHGAIFEGGYGARWLHSDRQRAVELHLRSDVFAGDIHLTVWLNGMVLYAGHITREPKKRTAVAAHLTAGWNALVFKANHRTWQWQVSVDVKPVGDDTLDDLRYAVEYPTIGAGIDYTLDEPGYVTLVIEDARSTGPRQAGGRRIRNLIGGVHRDAGMHTDVWDGLDDAGRPVPAGVYRWRGLVRGAITSHFQGAFNSPGNPPWITFDTLAQWYIRPGGSGGWLSDHERPLCAYAAGDRVYLGAAIAEAGHSIVEVDLDGRKRWGTLWLSLSGAKAFAVEGDVLYVTGEKGWMGEWIAVNRLDRRTHRWIGNPPDLKKRRSDACFVKEKRTEFSDIRGMVVTAEHIVLALGDRGRLVLFDIETAALDRELPFPEAGPIFELPDGDIVGISGRRVVKVSLTGGPHVPIVTEELQAPAGLAAGGDGTIYVSDQAAEVQCVKVFSAEGALVRRIGTPGGRTEGPFDARAMGHPAGLALDNRGQLWVAEHDFLPKRVSVWEAATGKLIRDAIGSPHYGGGGALDARDPHRAYYKGMVFHWQPWPGGATLETVLFRPELHPDLPYPLTDETVPQHPVTFRDRLYLVHDTGWRLPGVFIGEVKDKRLIPRVILGAVGMLRQAWAERHPAFVEPLGGEGAFLWCDANGDGMAEPEEVAVEPTWRFGTMWAQRSWPTLNLHPFAPGGIVQLAPRADGKALRYDVADARVIPLPTFAKGVGCLCPDLDGNLIVNCGGGGDQGDITNVLMGLAPDGRVRWTYPNPYPANWHDSPRPRPGDIQHTLNVEGVARLGDGLGGGVCQLNGNKGLRYLITTDGLFVCSLFGDMRLAPLEQSATDARLDMRSDRYSLNDECFHGWFGRAADGRYRQILGKSASSVFEVRGLDTLKRLDGGTVHLSAPVAKAAATAPDRPIIEAKLAGGPGMGRSGVTDAWRKLRSYRIPGDAPVAKFALAARPNDLQLWIEVSDPSPFQNAGGDMTTLFRSGDAIDLRFAADPGLPANRLQPAPGDQRFVIAVWAGKPVVVRYRFVVSEAVQPKTFVSPTGQTKVDEITLVDGASVTVEREETCYRVTASLPWTALGLDGRPSGDYRADVGVIFSDPGGVRAVERRYYYDGASGAMSDMPSEARVSPARWGTIRF